MFSHLLDPFHGIGRRVTCKVPWFRLICVNLSSHRNIFFEKRKCIPNTNSEVYLKNHEKKVYFMFILHKILNSKVRPMRLSHVLAPQTRQIGFALSWSCLQDVQFLHPRPKIMSDHLQN